MSKRKHSETDDTSSSSPTIPQIFESTTIHDRASKFIAIFSPSTNSTRQLQRHAAFESAMHRILAWRKPSAQRSLAGSFGSTKTPSKEAASKVVYETGSDEDGEKYAGKKLEKLLEVMNVEGTVVVARWYGGTLLGPVRFKWIEDAAREAILKSRADSAVEVGGKKVKTGGERMVEDTRRKEALVEVLKERDASIVVLRGLLNEKNKELKRTESGADDDQSVGTTEHGEAVQNPNKPISDYGELPLQRLEQMEKARDASLTWILKQIDQVEEKIRIAQKATT